MNPDEIYDEHQILAAKLRRRNKLRLQLAVFGLNADPSISIQIEDLDREISQVSNKLNIKPEGIFTDTSVNLNDRRVILLQVAYDQSYVVLRQFAECISVLLDFCDEKPEILAKDSDDIKVITDKYEATVTELWKEYTALGAIFKENRLYFSKKADNAIAGFIKKVFRFIHIDWFDIQENLKEEILEWDDYIDKAHRSIVDVARAFIEVENKS